MAEEWLSAAAVGSALGVKPNTVRMRAKRGNWQKRTNNFGGVEYLVDLDHEGQRPGASKAKTAPLEPAPVIGPELEAAMARVSELEGQVLDLSAQLTKVEGDARAERLALIEAHREALAALSKATRRRSLWQSLFGRD